MHIRDSKGLINAIDALNERRSVEENKFLDRLHLLKQHLHPVYQVNKLLPGKVPVAEVLNKLPDESIIDVTHLITNKLDYQSTDSLLKKQELIFYNEPYLKPCLIILIK